jgi:hypothetical protein
MTDQFARLCLCLAMLFGCTRGAARTSGVDPKGTAALPEPRVMEPPTTPAQQPRTADASGAVVVDEQPLSGREARARACPGIDASEAVEPGRDCTLVGCDEFLAVQVTASADIPPGHYRLVLAFDEQRFDCRATLPFTKCTGFDCETKPNGWATDCSFYPSFAGLVGGWTDTYPRIINVDLFKANTRIAAGRFEPTYSAYLPNGPGCGGGCCSGRGRTELRRIARH